jgi:hypothetical protein
MTQFVQKLMQVLNDRGNGTRLQTGEIYYFTLHRVQTCSETYPHSHAKDTVAIFLVVSGRSVKLKLTIVLYRG